MAATRKKFGELPSGPRRFKMMLYPRQAEFLACQSRYRGFCGGRGSGKSLVGAYDLLLKASQKRDRLYLVVAPNFPILRDSSQRTFLSLAKRTGLLVDFNKTERRALLKSGSEVVFKSAEDPDGLRGPNISGLWLDEAQGISHLAFTIAIGCLREDPDYNWCSATFTPKGRLHWTYPTFARQDADGRFPPNTSFFHSKTADNPFLPDSFESDLRSQYTSSTAEQELEGLFLDIGGQMFKREWFANQIINAAPRSLRRVRYWDKACLTENSVISSLRGDIRIKDIVAGDMVLTRHGYRLVKKAWLTKTVDEVVSVEFSNGSTVTGTHDHPVWTKNRDWADLGSLNEDDECVSLLDGFVRPISRKIIRGEKPVYDLEVEDAHEFFADGVLVHNSTKGGGCYTAGVLIGGSDQNEFFIEHVIRGQWSTLQRDEIIGLTAELDLQRYGPLGVSYYIEQEGGAGGKDSVQATIRQLAGHIVHADRVAGQGNKRVRAEPFAAQCEARNVFLVYDNESPWISDFIDELCFAGDAPVLTSRGVVEIRDVKTGDMVMTRRGWRAVSRSHCTSPAADVYKVAIRTPAGMRQLVATANHPVLVDQFGFAPVSALRRGHVLFRHTGDEGDFEPDAIVESVTRARRQTPVYNLEVEDCHEFTVDGILVHNCQFPEGTYSDQVDAASGSFNQLNGGSYAYPVAGGGSLNGAGHRNGNGHTMGVGVNTSLRNFVPR